MAVAIALLGDVQAGFAAVNSSLAGKAKASDVATAAQSAAAATTSANVAKTTADQAKADAAAALAVAYNGGAVITNTAMTPVAKSRLTLT